MGVSWDVASTQSVVSVASSSGYGSRNTVTDSVVLSKVTLSDYLGGRLGDFRSFFRFKGSWSVS